MLFPYFVIKGEKTSIVLKQGLNNVQSVLPMDGPHSVIPAVSAPLQPGILGLAEECWQHRVSQNADLLCSLPGDAFQMV